MFTIFLDELRDVSIKEQMVVCINLIKNWYGEILERFIKILHLTDALDFMVTTHGLIGIAWLRGQGYDCASNM